MRRFVGYIATKRGMSNSLRILMTSNSSLFAGSSRLLLGAFGGLLERAAEQGAIRKDLEATDVLHALSSIYSIPDAPDWRDRSHRLIGLLMDGLRCRK
jgi:hypothetical protein